MARFYLSDVKRAVLRITLFSWVFLLLLSGCVTQQYGDDDNPIVKNESSDDDIALTRISLGLGYLKMGNTTQAKLNLEKAKRFSPKLVQVHTGFAHYYDTVGEPELAVASYEKALTIASDDPDTLNNYGVFLCRQNKLEKAEEQFLKAIAVPSYILVSQSYENLALCQLRGEHFTKAEEYLYKAISHSPSRASALQQMTRLQYIKADYQTAKKYLKRYEKSSRRFSPTTLALAYKVFQKQGDDSTAKNYAAMLVKMFPNSYQAQQYLLNGLIEIEPDDLAKRYQAKYSVLSDKRVVILKADQPVNTQVHRSSSVKANKHVERFLAKSTVNAAKVVAAKENKRNLKTSELNVNTRVIKGSNSETDNVPVHRVKSGDTLFTISSKYNINMSSLARWNNLSKKKLIKVGDALYLADPRKVVN